MKKLTNSLPFLLFLFFTSASNQVFANNLVNYKLNWEVKDLDVEIKMALAPVTIQQRTSEFGLVTDNLFLPIENQIENNTVDVVSGESAYIYLFIKNKSKKTIQFAVAPHSIEPPIASLGFTFHCLCNGHIYEIPPGKIWYRIMELATKSVSKAKKVSMNHYVFKAKKQ